MTPERRRNLDRLLVPRHVAVIGGQDAAVVAGECTRIGYAGPIWPVNPKRRQIAGHRCFARIEDLPEPPDAAFLAVPRDVAIDLVGRLNRFGAGGVVCYGAGFGEAGAEGAAAERALIKAAGDLALVGPNCYGVINYLDRVALWPFAHGGSSSDSGAAIVTQSGMLSSDLTISQRSLPFAYMISAGNQAVLGLEDYLDALAEQPKVRAIGLHIEGLRNVARFAAGAIKALEADIPIVALKTGTSKIGARLTVSHTGSLSGPDELIQALFDRLGIIRVESPAQLLETLKFICVAGVPKGARIAGFTCSGGGATMLADRAERLDLSFPMPSQRSAGQLKPHLPAFATLSNPLDYTTFLWGGGERLRAVFEAYLADPYDVTVMVQDYPPAGLDDSKPIYLSDAEQFIAATRHAGLPAAICASLPENIDAQTRDLLRDHGVAPMQGIHEVLEAIKGAVNYGRRRRQLVTEGRLGQIGLPEPSAPPSPSVALDEWQSKSRLRDAGLRVPDGRLVPAESVGTAAAELGFPVVLKRVDADLAHKTEAGAVVLGLTSSDRAQRAAAAMGGDQFLVEQMVADPVLELLVGIRNDPLFGFAMTLAGGGILVELLSDSVTILLPAARADMQDALNQLTIAPLLDGYRGRPAVDRAVLLDALALLADYARSEKVGEIEINPLLVLPDHVCAVDARVVLGTNA